MIMKNEITKIYFVFAFLMASQIPAQAYLDPGTGSLVLQILIATFAGVIYWCKVQWNNIKGFFVNLCQKKK